MTKLYLKKLAVNKKNKQQQQKLPLILAVFPSFCHIPLYVVNTCPCKSCLQCYILCFCLSLSLQGKYSLIFNKTIGIGLTSFASTLLLNIGKVSLDPVTSGINVRIFRVWKSSSFLWYPSLATQHITIKNH